MATSPNNKMLDTSVDASLLSTKEVHHQQDIADDALRWKRYILTSKAIAHDDMKSWLRALVKL